MFKFRVFLVVVGSLLAVLGIVISLVAGINGILASQQPVSPFDQTDAIIVPDKSVIVPYIAPTIIPPPALISSQGHYQPQQAAGQDPANFRVSPTPAPIQATTPDRLVIPAIQLDAPIIPATQRTIAYMGKIYPQWKAPDLLAAGWASNSASPGILGNMVLFGHNNVDGEIFAHLADLHVADLIYVYSGDRKFIYTVALKMILPERNQPVDIRLQNARWILPSEDERLTLVTCWPYTSNTDRLILVAIPINVDGATNLPVVPRLTPLAP